MQHILAEAIDHVADAHGQRCDLKHPGTPASSVTLLRARDDGVDYLVRFDSVIVLSGPFAVRVLSDDRVEQVAQAEHQQTQAHPIGSPEHRDSVRKLVAAQRFHRNRPGGYWVAAANPDAAFEALAGFVPRTEVSDAALLTDGASCLVDRYHAAEWPEFMDLLRDRGPTHVIARVREAENSDPTGSRWPRYKHSDDATVAYCSLH